MLVSLIMNKNFLYNEGHRLWMIALWMWCLFSEGLIGCGCPLMWWLARNEWKWITRIKCWLVSYKLLIKCILKIARVLNRKTWMWVCLFLYVLTGSLFWLPTHNHNTPEAQKHSSVHIRQPPIDIDMLPLPGGKFGKKHRLLSFNSHSE